MATVPDDSADVPPTEEILLEVVGSAVDHPTVFADGCLYAVKTGGLVRLTFVETIIEAINAPNPGPKTRHVGTLVLPLEGLKATLTYLNKLAGDWDAADGL